jgi:hypothetical protein
MARILVTSDDGKRTLVDERHVDLSHVETPEGAGQLLERLAWGIEDAERRLGPSDRERRRRPRVGRGGIRAPRRRLGAVTSYDEEVFGS